MFVEHPTPSVRTSVRTKTKYVWIVVIGFIIYCQALFFKFTYLDDNVLILENYHFLSHLSNIFKTFKMEVFHILHASAAYYRPLLIISFILDAQLGKTSPFIYHLTNLAFHLSSSCLLFLFLKKLKYPPFLAWLFALIFTLHPVLTQAVVWIPGRNDSLLTLFVLLTFIFLINFLETKKWLFFFNHLLFFAFALFTKETALLVPLILLFYLWLINKKKITLNEKWAFVFSWIIVLFFWLALRKLALKNPIKTTTFSLLKSFVSNSPAFLLYLGKIIFPFNLSVLPTIEDSNLIYGIITIILLTIVLFLSKSKRFNFIIFGLLWFFLFLFPSLIDFNPHLTAYFMEHRLYLPLIGFIITILEIDGLKNLNFKKRAHSITIMLIIFILSFLTLKQSGNFKDRLSFWQNAVKTSSHHPLAHRNLGAMYYLDKRLEEAEKEYKKALELNASEPMVHNNLGLIYMDKGLFDKAEEEYKKELKINPYYDKVHFNLGLLYYQQGKKEKAKEWWQKTVAINPEYFSAHLNLAIIYSQQKEFDKAAYHLNQIPLPLRDRLPLK